MVFEVSEFISICEILVNAILILWIAYFIQKSQVNSRTLKDYYISEVNNIKVEVSNYLDNVESSTVYPKEIQNWFFLKLAALRHINEILNSKYEIKSDIIISDLIDLQNIMEDDFEFLINYRRNNAFRFEELTLQMIRDFRAQKLQVFHQTIVLINDYNPKIIKLPWN